MTSNNSLIELDDKHERRRFYRRSEDTTCGIPSPEYIAALADLKARVISLEEEKRLIKVDLEKLEAELDNLKEVKTLVVAWSMVAGSVSAIIYSNFTQFKKLFD